MERQFQYADSSTKRLDQQHKEKIALLEKQALQQKQQLLRGSDTCLFVCLSTFTSVGRQSRHRLWKIHEPYVTGCYLNEIFYCISSNKATSSSM